MTKLKYDTRNRENIAKLGDNTKAQTLKWYKFCEDNNIEILIYETIRTIEQQRVNVANGASQTMQSYHIIGQALDFVPIDNNGNALWNGYKQSDIQKAIRYAKTLGFEWGGDWVSFVDSPHLQYNYKGYGSDTFGKKVTTVSKPTIKNTDTIVGYLNSKDIDSSYPNREKLAEKYGISNYAGKEKQNIQLLALIKTDNSKKDTNTTPSTPVKNETLIDYMNSKKLDSTYTNRTKLAKEYGINNYTGTA
ncbi:M15 family metallopeptidase, partial [Streptomyces sp. NPDC057927]